MKADSRPYLTERCCGRCLVPFDLLEWRAGGWLFVRHHCPNCGYANVVTFSPQELEEWERRSRTRAVDAGL